MAETFTKQPHEAYTIALEFLGKLPSGTTISSAVMSAINTSTLVDATADVLDSATGIISGTQVRCYVKGGVSGVDYKITAVVTLTPGTPAPLLEEDILMEVREL